MKKLMILVVSLVGLVLGFWAFLRRFLPTTRGMLVVPGLKEPVEVIRDQWGVPHIYAANEDDLFLAQGYVHAQDRLWQMDLQRRAGMGRLAEVLGEEALELDRFFRGLGLKRAAEGEAQALQGEVRRVMEAYAAGVNAYMQQRRGRLSVEFSLLRYEPEPWRLADTIVWVKMMALGNGSNSISEVLRTRFTSRLGAELAADLEPTYPADNRPPVVGAGPVVGTTPAPNGWGSAAVRDALQLVESLLGGQTVPPAAGSPIAGLPLNPGASNQWVVDGSRTASGQPLLANDTHMAVSLPAIWYQVHLVAGRYNVTGASLPGVPGLTIGHNEHCAWGITIGWQDMQDLYVERPNPENPHQFEYQGQWQDAEVVQEVIRVKGRPEPVVEEILITRHGPIISGLLGEETPMALRWVALESYAEVDSILALNRAASWEEFRTALSLWSAPSCNFNYADVEGNIGFLQAGHVPVRTKGHGIAPVPGWTGEHEWERYLTVDELPQVKNPECGWIVAANNLVVDSDYPHMLSTDLENPCRAIQATELLSAKEVVTPSDFVRFQRDTYSAQAVRFLRHLLPIQPTNVREHQALTYLREWNHRVEADSVAATIYEVCRLRALHLVFDGHLGDLADAYVGRGITPAADMSPYLGRSFARLLEMLDTPGDTVWLQDPETGFPRFPREILHMALRQTLKWLRVELGNDMATWTWGRLNRVTFAHPVGSVKPLNLLFNRGPYPTGGDPDTLLRAAGSPKLPFDPVSTVDTLRFIADLSDWDSCQMMIPGGQSGHVASRHYDDRIGLWRDGVLLPMPFSRQQVERAGEARLFLKPG